MGCTDWKVVETGKGREKKTQNSSNKSGNSTFCHFFFLVSPLNLITLVQRRPKAMKQVHSKGAYHV